MGCEAVGIHRHCVRATSFIPHERLDRWHAEHPMWPIAEIAAGVREIRVPRVAIGRAVLQDVSFSTRPEDDVFEGDVVDGKLGANAFSSSVVTID